jgi:alkylated DNA nucleotide flippase Atl1
MNPYLEALKAIPRGQTRSFMELAALAGRPGAARAAGRALAGAANSSSSSDLPWYRVVSTQKRPTSRQLLQLRREGARPRSEESSVDWARRARARYTGLCGTHQFASPADGRTEAWDPERVEAFADEASALSRGFVPVGTDPSPEVPLPETRSVEATAGLPPLHERLRSIDWPACKRALRGEGLYLMPELLSPSECATILNKSTRRERNDVWRGARAS